MDIKQAIIPSENRPGLSMTPKYLTIHETGNTSSGADAASHAEWLPTVAPNPSYHFTVDDKEVYEHLPLDENGWHAADGFNGPGNRTTIGIEICVNSDGDFEKAKRLAAELCAWLVNQVPSLKPFPEVLTQHNDWNDSRNCPRFIRERGEWDSFVNMVGSELQEKSVAKKNPMFNLPDAVYRLRPTYTSGTGVREVQKALNFFGYDTGSTGRYGPLTQKSVKEFQKDAGITVDGIYGPETKGALIKALDEPGSFALPEGIIRLKDPYENGSHVREVQKALEHLGFPGGTSGFYGPKTEQSVRDFQNHAGITVDGIYGPETKAALEARL